MSHSHGTSSSSSSEEVVMMIPYFHFTGGDNLFFSAWKPTSAGAIGGACVGIFSLAIIERLLSAVRATCEARWHQRALALSAAGARSDDNKLEDLKAEGTNESQEAESSSLRYGRRAQVQRTIFPFIPAHDVPRGVMHSFQALIGYLLMLAVMTFNVSYILSAIIGVGVGEILFGRLGGLGGGHMVGGH